VEVCARLQTTAIVLYTISLSLDGCPDLRFTLRGIIVLLQGRRLVEVRQIMFDAACLLSGALYGSDSMEVRQEAIHGLPIGNVTFELARP